VGIVNPFCMVLKSSLSSLVKDYALIEERSEAKLWQKPKIPVFYRQILLIVIDKGLS
jgi:hypothetical protein